VDFLELTMRATRNNRRGLTLAVIVALLTTAACGATAATAGKINHAASRPAGGANLTGDVTAATPGWRVVKTFGPDPVSGISGLLTAVSATDAWSVWSGSRLSVVEHWTGGAWHSVPLPARLDAYVKSAVSIGASSASDVWLFGTYRTTEALRWTGGEWLLQPIPSWVLRKSSGTVTATSAVFGPRNVWVFSLGAGPYAAHYDGHSWAKVKLPVVPLDVSAAGPDDIWADGQTIDFVMHWNGKKWATAQLPLLPLPYGATVSYSNITAIGPENAWLFRTISYQNGPPPSTAMMHWNGKAWLTAASPADIVGSLVPDGNGGLWADGIDINPGGFWYFYHLERGRWTQFTPPDVDVHSPEILTRIPGTRSVWATGSNFNAKGYFGVLLKYGP
jgi:hypothetical protein